MEFKHVEDRVIVMVDMKYKNSHSFESGEKINLERQYNNLNRRETEPVNAIVVSGENLKAGTEILIDHNATHDTYKIFIPNEDNSPIKYFSVPVDQCYLYKDENNEWKGIEPYHTALRVFKPYEGNVAGIKPTVLKDTLYVTSGEYKGQVIKTLIGCDYCVVFQDANGREGNVIRFLPNGQPNQHKEAEAIAILKDLTNQVNFGNLLVGINTEDARIKLKWEEGTLAKY